MATHPLPKIIGLAGYARVGKDTLAAVLVGLGYEIRSLGAALRQMAWDSNPYIRTRDGSYHSYQDLVNTHGYESAKNNEPAFREYLVRLAESGRRELGATVWTRSIWQRPVTNPVVISDVRNLVDVEDILARGGIVIRVSRPGDGPVNTTEAESLAQVTTPYSYNNTAPLPQLPDHFLAWLRSNVVKTLNSG
jgi:hypothetical protein